MPFFSIVIPTYNRAEIIGKTIQSVINQQFKDWELIIIDDGGTDNTKKIITDFNDTRIKYYWKDNGERGAARNFGVKKARGNYVFFLDSDDLIYVNHLAHAEEKLQYLDNPAFFHSRYEEVFPNKTVQVEKLNQKTIWQTIQKQNKIGCPFFLRKDIALRFPFSENRNLKIGEDWLVILKLGNEFKLNISNKITMGVIQHATRSMNILNYKDVLLSKNLIIEELNTHNSINLKKTIVNVDYELTSLAALSAALNNEKWVSLKIVVKLFLNYPIKICKQRRTLAILKHLISLKH